MHLYSLDSTINYNENEDENERYDINRPTIPHKIFGTKWSKSGQEKKSLVSVSACFLTAIGKV